MYMNWFKYADGTMGGFSSADGTMGGLSSVLDESGMSKGGIMGGTSGPGLLVYCHPLLKVTLTWCVVVLSSRVS